MAEGKKVLILLGSPRAKGNTAALAAEVAKAAEAAGASVETVFLHGLDIRPCTGCGACQKKNARGCVIADDMRALYPKLEAADALVFATPVYWFNMSAQTKLLMDRCYALITPSGHAFAGKKIGIVMTYGGADVFSSGGVNALRSFQDAFRFIGAQIVGTAYGMAWRPADVRKNRALRAEAAELGKALAS